MTADCPHAATCPINAKKVGCSFSGKLTGGKPFWLDCWHLSSEERGESAQLRAAIAKAAPDG